MSGDEGKMTWRSWASGVAAVVVATSVVFLLMHLRVLYLGVDSVPGFAVRGDDVVVFERVFGGEESAGGDRLVRLDVRSGEVKRRVRADDGEWLGEVAGLVWFKVHDGLEARDFDSLELKLAAKDLLQKFPELAGLHERFHCYDRPVHALRFTTPDGRHVSFDLAAQVMSPTSDTGCASRSSGGFSATLADGRTLELRRVPQTDRSELALRDGEALGSSGLEVQLLFDRQKNLVRLEDDVLLLRRTGTAQTAPTQLVRVSLTEKKERWATTLHAGRLGLEDLVVVSGVIVMGDGHRVFAVDATSGALKWQRTP